MNWSELVSGPTLRWVQPSIWKLNYQLVRGHEVIASLRFKSSLSHQATVENADGCWTFDRSGFLRPRISVRLCGSGTEIASFRYEGWKGGGTLEFQNRPRMVVTGNLWQTHLEFREASGESFMRFKYDSLWCTSATVGIPPSALSEPEMSWIVALGWYLMMMTQKDGG
jgi:hypothetical protein